MYVCVCVRACVHVCTRAFLWSPQEFCASKLDLIFLLDGSGSITQVDAEGFTKQKEFVKNVASFFDIGKEQTRIGVAYFSGHVHSQATPGSSLPNCPKNANFEADGLGCICAPGASCTGTPLDVLTYCQDGIIDVRGLETDVRFYPHDCLSCGCGPEATWESVYGPAAVTHFNLADFSDAAAVLAAVDTIPFPDGGTQTSEGLRHVRESMLTLAAGVRPLEAGVPRVVIVLTDGQANDG